MLSARPFAKGVVLSLAVALGLTSGSLIASDLPTEHFSLDNPATITPEQAFLIYRQEGTELASGYAGSDDPIASAYRSWRPFSTAPYLSATHGNRYVNNYGNHLAEGYSGVLDGDQMPAGAVLAKDSFSATEDGRILAAPLFIMEKLAPGSSPETADWRYEMILPDGSVFGDSGGFRADAVGFCHTCHQTVADQDYLFYIPRPYRRAAN